MTWLCKQEHRSLFCASCRNSFRHASPSYLKIQREDDCSGDCFYLPESEFFAVTQLCFSMKCGKHMKIKFGTRLCVESEMGQIFLQCVLILDSHIGIHVTFTTLDTFLHSLDSQGLCFLQYSSCH